MEGIKKIDNLSKGNTMKTAYKMTLNFSSFKNKNHFIPSRVYVPIYLNLFQPSGVFPVES